MRTAIVHDWLTGVRGGEKVLSQLCSLLPGADLLTLLHVKGTCGERIEATPVRQSWMGRLPGVRRYYRYLLPLMPKTAEALPADEYDFVLSSSHCVAKGIIPREGALHVCYCHSPMRYAWSQAGQYRRGMSGAGGLGLRLMGSLLRRWDKESSARVDAFIANSAHVAGQIREYYGRDAAVVHPPIDTEFCTPGGGPREDFYLVVSALAPYKRVEDAVVAFGQLGRELRIIGDGQQMAKLRRMAPANVKLLGWQSDEAIREHYRRCRAVVFPGQEDFGMVPLEACACGAPVIAFGGGGALETVCDVTGVFGQACTAGAEHGDAGLGPTGMMYVPQTVEALVAAVRDFEDNVGPMAFEVEDMVAWAGRFSAVRFVAQMKQVLTPLLAARGLTPPWM